MRVDCVVSAIPSSMERKPTDCLKKRYSRGKGIHAVSLLSLAVGLMKNFFRILWGSCVEAM
eukprot:401626-Amorphochlora_amoeboformis.AAC.2